MSMTKDILKFHQKFGISYEGLPRLLPESLYQFRCRFLMEELDEFFAANERRDKEKALDALVDLVYVALGTAHMMGMGEKIFEEAWKRVHAANMKKIRCAGKGRHQFDVVKPKNWIAPSLKDLVC